MVEKLTTCFLEVGVFLFVGGVGVVTNFVYFNGHADINNTVKHKLY